MNNPKIKYLSLTTSNAWCIIKDSGRELLPQNYPSSHFTSLRQKEPFVCPDKVFLSYFLGVVV